MVSEVLKSREEQGDSDPWIDLLSYMSLGGAKIPERFRMYCGRTRPSSFFAVTGCDPRRGAIASTVSLAAIAGVGRYYLETVVMTEPEFWFMWRDGRAVATYPGSFRLAWDQRTARIQAGQRERAGLAGGRPSWDVTSGAVR